MGADIVVLRMQGSKFVLEDRFADDWATPILDAHQDVELLSAVRDASSGRTSFSFKRPLKTCDGGAASEARDWLSKMDIDIDPSRPSEIIWAMGAQDTFTSMVAASNRVAGCQVLCGMETKRRNL